MTTEDGGRKSRPILAWAAVIVGVALLLSGAAATIGYLGLPLLLYDDDLLTPQLGGMAVMFLGLVCGALALGHGANSLRGRPSGPLRLPPVTGLVVAFALVLGLGNVVLDHSSAKVYLFPPLFLLGAALPTLVVLSWVGDRLAWPATRRQGALALVSGSTLSFLVTLLLGSILPFLLYALVWPLEELLWDLPLLGSREGLLFLVFVALQAPIPEEFAKALGPGLFGRRLTSERQAFFVGLASGAGFAILENMLYQGLYARWSGWAWGGVTLLRAAGSVLHPLGTAIIARAVYRARGRPPGWFGQLARAYLLSVGLHTLWNGGFELLTFFTGVSHYSGRQLNVYGEGVSVGLVAYLVVLSAVLWRLMARIVRSLAREGTAAPAGEAPRPLLSPRAVAVWAVATTLVIVPIGAALGPAWQDIRHVLLGTL